LRTSYYDFAVKDNDRIAWAIQYSESMRVIVLYFGILRDRFGRGDEALEMAEGATVGGLLDILRMRTSNHHMNANADAQLWRSLAVAVNREYSSLNALLAEGDEIALLPPVSGGVCEAWSRDEG
jgi:MoaD family protein